MTTILPGTAPRPPLTRRRTGLAPVIAFISRKGGVGKSTIANAVLHGLALRGWAVAGLEIDDNPRLTALITGGTRERNAQPLDDTQTTYSLFTTPELGMGRSAFAVDTREQLARTPYLAKDVVARLTAERGWERAQAFDFVPGSERLRLLENKLVMATASHVRADFDPYTQLARALETIRPRYDVVVMDTPPSLATIQYNVLMAATHALYVVDFDADSIEDYDRTRRFYRDVCAAARQMGRPLPAAPGVVYNKYDAEFEENDVRLLHAYTTAHHDPETGRQEPPMVSEPALGVIPFDRRRLVGAMNARMSLHTYAPTSEMGRAMDALTRVIEAAVGLV